MVRLGYWIGIVAILLSACAQQGNVTGGEKDTAPPKIEASSPVNFSTNFSGNKIVLEFDEYVKVKSLTQELLVSPPLKYTPEYHIKGKRVFIDILDTLLPNTTYSFYFGEAIVDNNEGNALDSNLIVFSTGDKLDSLEVKGVVLDAYTKEPVADYLVMLYSDTTDTVPKTTMPTYISKTNDQGEFLLRNLAEGTFRLLALNDLNRSRTYDLPNEQVGFPDAFISTLNPYEDLNLLVSSEKSTVQRFIKGGQINHRQVQLKFELPVSTLELDLLSIEDAVGVKRIWNDSKDSLNLIFLDTITTDSLSIGMLINDTLRDTASLRFEPYAKFAEKMKKNKKLNDPVAFSFKKEGTGNQHFNNPVLFKGAYPIESVSPASLIFRIEQDTVDVDSTAWSSMLTWCQSCQNDSSNQVRFTYDWGQGNEYGLSILPGGVQDILGQTNRKDTLAFSWTTGKTEDYGNLILVFKGSIIESGHYIIQLLDGENEVVDQRIVSDFAKELTYPLTQPGKYGFRMIVDRNANGVWDPGNYDLGLQPEEVYYYPDPIDLKANWDFEAEWTIIVSQ